MATTTVTVMRSQAVENLQSLIVEKLLVKKRMMRGVLFGIIGHNVGVTVKPLRLAGG